jgi:hypothetical protein
MGCTSNNSSSEINDYQQEKIELELSSNIKELFHARSLINLITRIRNKIIHSYHKLIYSTGACVYIKPTIAHCLKCIFYKVSSEFGGNLTKADITHKEDPPYLKLSSQVMLSDKSYALFNEMFNFIIELTSYKSIIKQIDKETPELLYLIYEEKDQLSQKNIELINRGIELLKNLKKMQSEILTLYKVQISEFAFRNSVFCEKIDSVGKNAFLENVTDIYEIAMLQKKIDSIGSKNKDTDITFNSVYKAKMYMENIINNENDEDIIESHESIIENMNNSYDEIKE